MFQIIQTYRDNFDPTRKIQTLNKMETVYANGMMNGTNGQAEMAAAQSVLNWNPNQLDIKTKSVEKTLEPLVMQVCIYIHQCCQILYYHSNANLATLFQILKLNITTSSSSSHHNVRFPSFWLLFEPISKLFFTSIPTRSLLWSHPNLQ